MFFIQFALSILLTPLVFAGIGLILSTTALYSISKSKRAKGWVEMTATILDVRVEERPARGRNRKLDRDRKLCQVIVNYEYAVEGRPYHSHQLFWGDTGVASSQTAIAQRRQQYRAGDRVSVYYNPLRPKESVLKREVNPGTRTVLIIGGLLLVIGLAFGAIILPSALQTCGVTPSSTQVPPGGRPWCYQVVR